MTTYAVQPRRADGMIARLIILILLLILAVLVYDRFNQVLPQRGSTPAAIEAPPLPDDWLEYSETADAYQADLAVIEARRAYMLTQRMNCETLNREPVAPGVELVTCGSEQ